MYLSWIKQQEQFTESDLTGDARIKLSIDTAEILFHAGYIEKAKETLGDVTMQLEGQGGEAVIEAYWKVFDMVNQ